MSESAIEQQFVRWCERNNLYCPKLVYRVGSGWPDRTVLLPDGRVAWIEFKTPVGVLSPQQIAVNGKLAKYGHKVHVCKSSDEAIKICESELSSANRTLGQ